MPLTGWQRKFLRSFNICLQNERRLIRCDCFSPASLCLHLDFGLICVKLDITSIRLSKGYVCDRILTYVVWTNATVSPLCSPLILSSTPCLCLSSTTYSAFGSARLNVICLSSMNLWNIRTLWRLRVSGGGETLTGCRSEGGLRYWTWWSMGEFKLRTRQQCGGV